MDNPAISGLFDENGFITVDVSCRLCGYNLRGLRQEGRCPECGTAVGRSTLGDMLKFSDPDWVEKLALGVRLMLWGILLMIVVSVVGGCIVQATGMPQVFGEMVGLLSGLLNIYGAWLLTTPDPSRIGEDRHVTARRVIRFCLIVGLLGAALEISVSAMNFGYGFLLVLLGIPILLLQLTGVAGEFAKFRYIERLAERIPNRKLASFARFMRWAFSIGLAAMFLIGAALSIGFYRAGYTPTLTGLPMGTPTNMPTAAPGGIGGGAPGLFVTSISAPPSVASAPAGASSAPAGAASAPSSAASAPASAPALPSGRLIAVTAASVCAGVLGLVVFGILALVLYFQLAGELRRQAEAARLIWEARSPDASLPPAPNNQ